jgi:hypothetical protein
MLSPERRVAYVWSEELQRTADLLPANIGRSSRVHGLVKAFDLLSEDEGVDERDDLPVDENQLVESQAAASAASLLASGTPPPKALKGKARVVRPDLSLGNATSLKRYHDAAYVSA